MIASHVHDVSECVSLTHSLERKSKNRFPWNVEREKHSNRNSIQSLNGINSMYWVAFEHRKYCCKYISCTTWSCVLWNRQQTHLRYIVTNFECVVLVRRESARVSEWVRLCMSVCCACIGVHKQPSWQTFKVILTNITTIFSLSLFHRLVSVGRTVGCHTLFVYRVFLCVCGINLTTFKSFVRIFRRNHTCCLCFLNKLLVNLIKNLCVHSKITNF